MPCARNYNAKLVNDVAADRARFLGYAMNDALKQRLIGAAVLVALGVIFIPMVLDSPEQADPDRISTDIPPLPHSAYGPSTLESTRLPSVVTRDSPASVVLEPQAEQAAPVVALAEPEPALPAPTTEAPAEMVAAPEESTAPSAPSVATAEPPAREMNPTPPVAVQAPEPRAPGGSWVVQVGSFSQEQNALKLRDRLRGKGFKTFVEPAGAQDGTSYRVRVGPAADRPHAEALKEKLLHEENLDGLVASYP